MMNIMYFAAMESYREIRDLEEKKRVKPVKPSWKSRFDNNRIRRSSSCCSGC